MKKFSQCLLCKYVFGRTCKFLNKIITDEIYNNEIQCQYFKSLQDENLDCNDSCCSENIRYEQSLKRD